MSYAGILAIRESAGLLSKAENRKLDGVIDGTNKEFYADRRPIVDIDNDGEVTGDDVAVFVDSVAVAIESIEAQTGKITLVSAPAVNSVVTADWAFSGITDSYVEGKQQESDNWVDTLIRAYVKLPLDPVPGLVQTAAEMYAAGLILTSDDGARVDSEQTAKTGFGKIKLARQLIEDYIQGLKNEGITINDDNGNKSVASSLSDCDVFDREYEESYYGRGGQTDDEWFNRRH